MVEKGLGYERESIMQRSHAGGKGVGVSATRTRRRKERERKAEEETHAMDKPKTIEEVSDGDLSEIKKDPVWKSWLEMIIKPIPDSKGGKGSFQHCINANQDKHNPGGWCKQIERKIGKGLGALGEGKLNRKTGKPMKLKPRKITLDDYEHTDKPSYFEQVMSEEEKKKKEKKKASRKDRAILQQQKREHEAVKYAREHPRPPPPGVGYKPEQEAQYQEYKKRRDAGKADKIEEPETDYYMDAGGNPQLKEKTDYFVEEIRTNIIYHNKILPILGVLARGASMVGRAGLKIGDEILSDMKEVGQGAMQGIGDEAEEEEE